MISRSYQTLILGTLFFILLWVPPLSAKKWVRKFKEPAKPQVIKAKSYQHDTFAIIWFDSSGDGECNFAEFYEKSDDYFIKKGVPCDKADEVDQFILEPHI